MTRPRRWRCWGKWTAAAITVLLAAVWVASGWWVVAWHWASTANVKGFSVGAGRLRASKFETSSSDWGPWPGAIHSWRVSETGEHAPLWLHGLYWKRTRQVVDVEGPLWIPGSASLLAALILFRLDRRQGPGLCPRCRYDLSATPPSAPCPECGRAQQPPNAQAADPAARTTP
jgi:hypothetical protein